MRAYEWLGDEARSWSRYSHDDSMLDTLLAFDVRSGVRRVRDGVMPAGDLGEYVAGLVGLHAARSLELRETRKWATEARIECARAARLSR